MFKKGMLISAASATMMLIAAPLYTNSAAWTAPFEVCKNKKGKLRLIDAGAGDTCKKKETNLGKIGDNNVNSHQMPSGSIPHVRQSCGEWPGPCVSSNACAPA